MRKAFICPTKYVQGEDELLNLGYFVKTFGDSALLIANPDDVTRVQAKLDATAEKFGVKFVLSNFRGQCSRQEVARLHHRPGRRQGHRHRQVRGPGRRRDYLPDHRRHGCSHQPLRRAVHRGRVF